MLEKARDDLGLLGLLFELNDLFEMRVELVLVCCSRELNINIISKFTVYFLAFSRFFTCGTLKSKKAEKLPILSKGHYNTLI